MASRIGRLYLQYTNFMKRKMRKYKKYINIRII